VDLKRLDNIFEKGILGLVLAALLFSALATGAVRTLEFAIVETLVATAGILWLVRIWVKPNHKRLLLPPVVWPMLLFLGYAAFHYMQADVEYTARREVLRLVLYALLFLVVLNNLHKSDCTQLVLYVMLMGGTGIAIYGLVQVIAGSESVWHFTRPSQYTGRGSGTFINPNHFAGFLGMLLPLCLASVLTGRISQPMRILLGYSALMLLGGVAVSMSRGAWISTALMLLSLVVILGLRKQFRLKGIILTCVVLGIISLFFVKSDFAQSRISRVSTPGAPEHVGSRTQLWSAAADVWKEEKLLGVGPAHFDHRFPEHRPTTMQSRPMRVHNDYLNLLVDWGLIGLLLAGVWLGTLTFVIIRSWKYSQRTSSDLSAKTSNRAAFVLGSTLGLGALGLHSFVDFNLHIPSNAMLATTLAALLTAFIRFATERYWVPLKMPQRLALTVVVGGASVLLLGQALGQAQEHGALTASQEAKSFPEQVTQLERAMGLEPNNPKTAASLGEIHRRHAMESRFATKRSHLGKAVSWLRKAIRLNPHDAYSHARLGMALDQLNQSEEAEKMFTKAEQLDPNGYMTVAYIAWHKMHIKDYAAAKEYFERVSPLDDPSTPENESEKGLVAWRPESAATNLANQIRAVYLPYINEQIRGFNEN